MKIMVRLAVSSMFFHEYPIQEIFDFAQEAGLDSLEFWVETPHFWLRSLPVGELLDCIGEHTSLTPLTVHAPILDLNPCSINPEVGAISVHYATRAIELAEKIHAEVVTVHPGRRTAKRPPGDPDYRRFEHYLGELRTAASCRSVKVAIENMERKVNSLLCRPQEVRELLDREPWLWFTLDISHALATSINEVEKYIALCHDRIANIHLGRANEGTMHLPLDRDPDIARILRSLMEYGYDGIMTLEIEDRTFAHALTSEEKILLLMGEVSFVRNCTG